VHVLIGRSLVEVSTYRSVPESVVSPANTQSETLLEDNIFGTRSSDAGRRDFSINALYFDPVKREIIDYVGGFEDVEKRVLRVIGMPKERFTEDPVRMLRAVRFTARLGLSMDRKIQSVMLDAAPLLGNVPPARLLDEVIKLFHCGHSDRAFDQLQKFDLFPELFPESVRAHTDIDLDPKDGLLSLAFKNTDQRVSERKSLNTSFLFAVIMWRSVNVESELNRARGMPPAEALHRATSLVIDRQRGRLMIPRRMATTISDMWNLQRWLEQRRPRLVLKTLAHGRFRASYDLLMLRVAASEVDTSIGSWWTEIQEHDVRGRKKMISQLSSQKRWRKGRKLQKRY